MDIYKYPFTAKTERFFEKSEKADNDNDNENDNENENGNENDNDNENENDPYTLRVQGVECRGYK